MEGVQSVYFSRRYLLMYGHHALPERLVILQRLGCDIWNESTIASSIACGMATLSSTHEKPFGTFKFFQYEWTHFAALWHLSLSSTTTKLRIFFNTPSLDFIATGTFLLKTFFRTLKISISVDVIPNAFTISHDCHELALPIEKFGSKVTIAFCAEFLFIFGLQFIGFDT